MIPKINRLFFTIYFLLFAAFSPIHYYLDKSSYFTDNSLYGISFTKPIPSDDSCCEAHSKKHHAHFLMDETRTNNRSYEDYKITLLKKAVNIKDLSDLYFKPLFVNGNQEYIVKSVEDFQDLYSGLSPPII
jgi:hypothetical protein